MFAHKKLLNALGDANSFYIQTHNFPDHDSVAAAFALQYLSAQLGKDAKIIFEGEIQRDSLKKMIQGLGIDIRHASKYPLTSHDKIVVVDGCKGNKNVTDLIGDEIGVIDHHQVRAPDDVRFVDIRPEYGACSSIVFEYFAQAEIDIPQKVATALLVGINMDTALLTRNVSRADLLAYTDLYGRADVALVNSILINYIQTKDLGFFKTALDRVRIKETLAFCFFPEGCNQNLMGILGDFFMALQEIEFVVLCAQNGDKINFSVRSENREWNASAIIQEVLSGIGFGGGHIDRAGGIVEDPKRFSEEAIYKSFVRALKLPDITVF
ncbi:MAG: DHH family phosphoesterase [Leptospirales bacterium]|nr:DHH family phosphoesterase [Leptospirales bacterium]